jgi:hypothetical protein
VGINHILTILDGILTDFIQVYQKEMG